MTPSRHHGDREAEHHDLTRSLHSVWRSDGGYRSHAPLGAYRETGCRDIGRQLVMSVKWLVVMKVLVEGHLIACHVMTKVSRELMRLRNFLGWFPDNRRAGEGEALPRAVLISMLTACAEKPSRFRSDTPARRALVLEHSSASTPWVSILASRVVMIGDRGLQSHATRKS